VSSQAPQANNSSTRAQPGETPSVSQELQILQQRIYASLRAEKRQAEPSRSRDVDHPRGLKLL